MTNETKLYERLIKLREEQGLSQKEFAKELGVTRNTISNYELGITTPPYVKLKKYHEICQVPYEQLMDGEETGDYSLYLKISMLSKFQKDKVWKILKLLEE